MEVPGKTPPPPSVVDPPPAAVQPDLGRARVPDSRRRLVRGSERDRWETKNEKQRYSQNQNWLPHALDSFVHIAQRRQTDYVVKYIKNVNSDSFID
jgi:hypothetical protein